MVEGQEKCMNQSGTHRSVHSGGRSLTQRVFLKERSMPT